MKNFWKYLEEKEWQAGTKYKVAILILSVLFAIAGLAAWLVIHLFALSTWDWMICFIGYPILISWFAVLYYSGRYEFHDGSFDML